MSKQEALEKKEKKKKIKEVSRNKRILMEKTTQIQRRLIPKPKIFLNIPLKHGEQPKLTTPRTPKIKTRAISFIKPKILQIKTKKMSITIPKLSVPQMAMTKTNIRIPTLKPIGAYTPIVLAPKLKLKAPLNVSIRPLIQHQLIKLPKTLKLIIKSRKIAVNRPHIIPITTKISHTIYKPEIRIISPTFKEAKEEYKKTIKTPQLLLTASKEEVTVTQKEISEEKSTTQGLFDLLFEPEDEKYAIKGILYVSRASCSCSC